MTGVLRFLPAILLCAISLGTTFAKPTELIANPDSLSPVQLETKEPVQTESNRDQRSPQFGLLDDYNDYSDYDDDDDARHFKPGGYGRKHHKVPHKPFGGHGCHGFDCGHGYPGHEGHYGGHHPGGHHPGGHPPIGHYPGGQGGSFASASAGSAGGGGPFGGHSAANAQSASFSFGPYTASFSVAQASSARKGF